MKTMSDKSSKKPSEPNQPKDRDELRERLIGLGERSIQKSYFPELRKRSEELERFRVVMDHASDAIFVFQGCATVVDVNETACKFLGRSRQEMLGADMRDIFPPGSLQEVLGNHCAVLYGRNVSRVEVLLPDQPGRHISERNLELSFAVIRMDRQRYVVASGRDITARLRYEEALRAARDQAEAASQAKSDFLANMSHEIRTPLGGIMGMLQLMRSSAPDPQQRQYADTAMQSCTRLTRLLGDILDLSRIEAGRMDMISEPFDLMSVMESVDNLFGPAAAQAGIDFSVHVAPEAPQFLVGDVNRLHQVLNNLVGNAIKFTRAGTVGVEVYPLPHDCPEEARLLFAVSDTGVGIPENKLDSVFDTFSQAESSLTRNFQGAGLGLSIAKKLVALMDGEICIASRPGSGTAVHCCMTFGRSDAAESKAPEPREEVPVPSQLNVLVAEDDSVNRMAVTHMLQKAGCRVEAVENGALALERLRAGRFDAVLMDVQMPVMDGMEATRAIREGRAGAETAGVPVVALTAYAMADDRERFLEAGMDAYLSKPVDMNEMIDILRDVTGAKPEQSS